MPNTGKKENKIKLIKDYQKIAAGEVITRPADCVKELLENSIDAGSTQITIIIKDSGKELIQIIDNGSGIEKQDISFAFQAHYSSKIESIDDLKTLKTLGFRGEALASVCAISRVEVITKTRIAEMGTKTILEEGNVIAEDPIGSPTGTNIKVMDLFYNVPVRRKYLRSDKVEQGHITQIVCQYILAYPSIHIKLVHGNTPIINSPASKKKINAVFDVYGKNITKNLTEFSFNDSNFNIDGFLGDPSISRTTSNISSSLFVNGRFVSSPMINNAMKEAYKGYLMVNKLPFFILFMEFDPEEIDVNIHPTKKIIRFANETLILKRLTYVLKDIVGDRFGKDQKIGISSHQGSKNVPDLLDSYLPIEEEVNDSKSLLKTDKKEEDQKTVGILNGEESKEFIKTGLDNKGTLRLDKMYNISSIKPAGPLENRKLKEGANRERLIVTKVFPDMRFINEIGQLNKTYIILEGENGFYLLDQHAAAERVQYEQQMEDFKKGGLQRQNLLLPIKFDVSINEKDFMDEILPKLPKFGFIIDALGGTTYAIRSIPAILKKVSDAGIIKDICSEIIAFGKPTALEEEFDKILKIIACHKSLRGGEEIRNLEKIRKLILKLSKCKNPWHCAHGRPVLVSISYNDIEKMFHRIE